MSQPGRESLRPESRRRRIARQTSLVFALLGLVSVPALYLSGGVEVHVLGVEIRAHRPLRAFVLAIVGLAAFIALGGRLSPLWGHVRASLHWLLTAWDRHVWQRRPSPRTTALAMATAVFLLGGIFGSKTAGGSDSYGYVSQATDLWQQGRLFIDQPFAAAVPWPRARDTFMPLGYRALFHQDVPSLVPTYAPGLPLIFAAVRSVAGLDAMHLVVPLLGALLVMATYGIGCRLASPGVGLIGAVLVATSPAMLFQLMVPMTDVPVAALWAAAFYLVTGPTTGHALGAGLTTALAVLVRPNLVPLAAIAGLYYLPEFFGRQSRGRGVRRAVLFAAGVLPGIVTVSLLNALWYGSPFSSGYGRFSDLFGLRHVEPNLHKYATWLIDTHSPLMLFGLAALAIPARRLWPGLAERRRLVIAALLAAAVWAQYLAYLVFDAWWYLRFLLPAWPFMAVGAGAVVMAIWRPGGWLVRSVVLAGLAGVLLLQAVVADRESVFRLWHGERRYIAAAAMVQRLTPPAAVIFSVQHSGSVRYYGERLTMRFDQLDGAWLDRAVAWLGERGAPVFLLAEDWELPIVTRRFAGQRTLEVLDRPPMALYDEISRLSLFDLSGGTTGSTHRVTGVDTSWRATPPGRPPTLMLQPRVE